MKLIENFLINNDCYKSGKKITPKGLMLHSVGCPQQSAQVFIKNWNKPGVRKCVHGFIEPDTVYQTLPWTMRGWHAGGKANDSYIGVEMTEPATIKYIGNKWQDLDPAATKKHVLATYNQAVILFADLCKQFKLDPILNVISHSEGYKKGIASNHGDVEHIWSKLGLTMDKFRQDIKAAMMHYKVGETDIIELDLMDLRAELTRKPNRKNYVNGNFFSGWAVIGWLASEGKILEDRMNHTKDKGKYDYPKGTVIVFKDGSVFIGLKTDGQMDYIRDKIWFCCQGFNLFPLDLKKEGFPADVGRTCNRLSMGYRKKDNKILITMRPNSNATRAIKTLTNLECDTGICLDSGSSAEMVIDGVKLYKAKNTLTNIIYF